MSYTDSGKIIPKTLDASFRGAVFRYKSVVSYMNKLNQHNSTLKILDESLVTNQFVFYFSKHFYLVDEINDKIRSFHSAGLINCWMKKYSAANTKQAEGLSSLKLEQLSGIFEILLVGWIFSVILFVSEILYKHQNDKFLSFSQHI
jgi:hypothetical protein